MDEKKPALAPFLALVFALAVPLFSQETGGPVLLGRGATGAYTMTERSDWSRYDSGKYSGHVYREVRSSVRPIALSGGPSSAERYAGTFFVLEETLRDQQKSARAVDDVVKAEFTVAKTGFMTVSEDRGYPSLRGFPAFPAKGVRPGDRWIVQGERAVDPRNEGITVLLPIAVQYEYRGTEQYKGEAVHRVFAKYATRYRASGRPASFSEASGTHEVDILLRVSDGLPLMMRDRLDETFSWADGSSTRFKGFTLTFSEGSLPLDRGAVIAGITGAGSAEGGGPRASGGTAASGSLSGGSASSGAGGGTAGAGAASSAASSGGTMSSSATGGVGASAASSGSLADAGGSAGGTSSTNAAGPAAGPGQESGTILGAGSEGVAAPGSFELADAGAALAAAAAEGIDVEAVDEGLKLTVRDIRFVPDSDAVLPEERGRLDALARSLQAAGKHTILVEGHTAAVGKPAGELDLSIKRAKRIVDELAARGIDSDLLLYKGWGGTKPLADNGTDAGRARNRRVEITILE